MRWISKGSRAVHITKLAWNELIVSIFIWAAIFNEHNPIYLSLSLCLYISRFVCIWHVLSHPNDTYSAAESLFLSPNIFFDNKYWNPDNKIQCMTWKYDDKSYGSFWLFIILFDFQYINIYLLKIAYISCDLLSTWILYMHKKNSKIGLPKSKVLSKNRLKF